MAAKKLYTSTNISEELGVSASKVRKLVKDNGIEPAEKKGNCAYYDTKALNALKKAYKAEEKAKADKKKAAEKAKKAAEKKTTKKTAKKTTAKKTTKKKSSK